MELLPPLDTVTNVSTTLSIRRSNTPRAITKMGTASEQGQITNLAKQACPLSDFAKTNVIDKSERDPSQWTKHSSHTGCPTHAHKPLLGLSGESQRNPPRNSNTMPTTPNKHPPSDPPDKGSWTTVVESKPTPVGKDNTTVVDPQMGNNQEDNIPPSTRDNSKGKRHDGIHKTRI